MNQNDLHDYIILEAAKLGIDTIGFGSVNTMTKLQKKYYPAQKLFIPDYYSKGTTIIAAALSYNFSNNRLSPDSNGYIAHYTTANFYLELSKKLKKLGALIKTKVSPHTSKNDFFRVFVNSKINDKLAAYVSGLGYFAKNSLVFIPNQGTHFVIGELIISSEIPVNNILQNDCGTCNTCQAQCPTNAINEYGVIDKTICIQDISSRKEWPKEINGTNFVTLWGTRFFGCSICVDSCPYTSNNSKGSIDWQSTIGYIGTSTDIKNILTLTKSEIRLLFKKNQLSASWLPTEVLVRNALFSLYNQKQDKNSKDLIAKYLKLIDNFEWNIDEKNYLQGICKYLLDL